MSTSLRAQPLILVVDHEQALLDAVTAVLTASGFACRCCTSAEQAVAEAEHAVPDLILSDTNLQGDSGVEIGRLLQQHPRLADVPTMFLSGAQIPDIIRRSNGVRGAYYLRKPFDAEVLIELIETALRRSRMAEVSSEG